MAGPIPEQENSLANNISGAQEVADKLSLPAVVLPSPADPPRRAWSGRSGLAWLGLVLAGGLGLGLYLAPWTSGPTPVMVEIAALAPVTRVLAVNGRIAALHSVDVRALVGGTLSDVLVGEGDNVRSGEELARIDAATSQALLRQWIAGLDAANIAESQARDTFARTQALGANVTRATLEAAERAVQTATQEVARTTALVDQARLQLENFTIRAPMTGTVLTLQVDPGQSIDPATLLMTIADLDQLVVETDVDEAYATQIHTGLPAILKLTGETAPRDGRVSFMSQRVDAATGGLAVRLAFDDPVTVPVGLTVTANIIVDQRPAALTAPRAAVHTNDDGISIFVVRDGIATQRSVSVIDWPAARLIVTEGLAPGDLLITDATGITDGQAVRRAGP